MLEKKDRIVSQPASAVTVCFYSVRIQALYQQGTNQSLSSALELLEKVFSEITIVTLKIYCHVKSQEKYQVDSMGF